MPVVSSFTSFDYFWNITDWFSARSNEYIFSLCEIGVYVFYFKPMGFARVVFVLKKVFFIRVKICKSNDNNMDGCIPFCFITPTKCAVRKVNFHLVSVEHLSP